MSVGARVVIETPKNTGILVKFTVDSRLVDIQKLTLVSYLKYLLMGKHPILGGCVMKGRPDPKEKTK
jgi:hypothetical protein